VVALIEMPDATSMAVLLMVAGASGAIANLKTTVLIPISEAPEAARKAVGITYSPPGA